MCDLRKRLPTQAVIFVIDSTDEERLELAAGELRKLLQNEVGGRRFCGCGDIVSKPTDSFDSSSMDPWPSFVRQLLKDAVLLVFANKQDAKGALPAAQIATALKLTDLKSHTWHIQGCSALKGEGLTQGIDWITAQVTK